MLNRQLIPIYRGTARYSSSLENTAPEGSVSSFNQTPSSSLLQNCKNIKTKVVSRLKERHRLIAEGRIPLVSYEWEKQLWAKRERFGHYGLASGIDPSELWPTVEEIQEEEAIGWYKKYSDVLKALQDAKETERAAALERMKEVMKAEEKYPEMLENFLKTQKEVIPVKSKQELEAEQQSKDMLEYYGYEIDSSDPRFPILFEKMTEAKKKAAKLAEKEELTRKKRASRKKEKDQKMEEKK